MAKKDTINEAVYVKQLVDAGTPEEEAKTSVTRLISAINEEMAGQGNAEKASTIAIKIKERVRELKSDKFDITVLAAMPRKDSNEISRNVAIATYNNDPELALTSGKVKEVAEGTAGARKAKNGRFVIALDDRDFIDRAGTMKNRRKGQPYPVRMQSEFLVECNGQIGIAYGDVALDVGTEYTVFGKAKEGSNSLTVYADPTPRVIRKLNTDDLYTKYHAAAMQSDIAMTTNDALDTELKGYIIVKGIVQHAQTTANGGAMLVLASEIGDGLRIMTPFGDEGQQYVDEFTNVELGAEVLVIGKIRDSEQYGRSMVGYGVTSTNTPTAVTKTLNNLKDFKF